MAAVFPSVRPSASDSVSQAERDVLDALATLPTDWQVIHSLWLKTHRVKLHAEADFILVTDRVVRFWKSKVAMSGEMMRVGSFSQNQDTRRAPRKKALSIRLGEPIMPCGNIWKVLDARSSSMTTSGVMG